MPNKMFKFYLKKVSRQDVVRTTVINAEAELVFFGIKIPNRDDTATISVRYVSDNYLDHDVKIKKKQDIRIFLDRERYKEGDILLFENLFNGEFNLNILTPYVSNYGLVNSILVNNYLLTDDLPELIVGNSIVKDSTPKYMNENKSYPLNQILYGPPGTGKTYSTITRALNIIGLLEDKDIYSADEYKEAQRIFQNELGKRIEFVTMHQSFCYEDFVQGLKPSKSENTNGIVFDYKNGVFKEVCRRAEESYLLVNRNIGGNHIIIDKLFPSFLLAMDEETVYDILSKEKYEGRKISQKQAIEYFNKRLGKKYCKAWRDKFDFVLGDRSPRVGYQPDKFREGEFEDFTEYIEIFSKLTPEQRRRKLISEWLEENPIEDPKESAQVNHVIILDEINRANISRVFGELIALIEQDKRDGKLTVTLPSGEAFSVPSNLYIIGTMNTADKSIALVDIALRRRFEFIPLYPNGEKLEHVLKENEFSEDEILNRLNLMLSLNKIIRAKKSVDFELGHAYFMKNDFLKNILNNQILPLLTEYFMYDLKKVKEILEKPQKDRDGNVIPELGITINQDLWQERGLLEVVNIKKRSENNLSDNLIDSSSKEIPN